MKNQDPQNAFVGQATKPSEEQLTKALVAARIPWNRFLLEVAEDCGAKDQEWKCYSRKSGWALRLKRKERTIAWLSPAWGCFDVLFILGDKALEAARQGRSSQRVVEVMERGVKYPEGTGVRLTVRSPETWRC